MDFAPSTSHVPFYELLDLLESHLKHQTRMPNLNERLNMAAAKALAEGRSTMTDSTAKSSGILVEKAHHEVDAVSIYMIAAE